MCQYCNISYNNSTILTRDANNRRNCVWRKRVYGNLLYFLLNFSINPKLLKKQVYKLPKKHPNKTTTNTEPHISSDFFLLTRLSTSSHDALRMGWIVHGGKGYMMHTVYRLGVGAWPPKHPRVSLTLSLYFLIKCNLHTVKFIFVYNSDTFCFAF